MNIKCPHCGTEYEVERELDGQYITCESCGKEFVVWTTINQPMTGATSLRANTPHTGRGMEREFNSVAVNTHNRRSPMLNGGRVPEYKYFLAWLAYAVVSWLGSTLISMATGAVIGAVMGANGASVSAIASVCATVGAVVSIPVGYFSFRYIAIAILNRWR